MSRQQRTNYRRQRVTPSTPRQYSDFVWSITDVTGAEVTLSVAGDFTGFVYEPAPAFFMPDEVNPVISTVFTPPAAPGDPGTIVLTFTYGLISNNAVELSARSDNLRNAFGGGLSAGKIIWIAPPPPPAFLTVSSHSEVMTTCYIVLSTTSVNVGVFNAGDVIQNQSTAEWGVIQGWDGVNLIVDFPTYGLTSGDTIICYADDARVFNSDGSHLAAFDFIIP